MHSHMLADTSGITAVGDALSVLAKAADPAFQPKGFTPVLGWTSAEDTEGRQPKWAQRFIRITPHAAWAVGPAPTYDLWLVLTDGKDIVRSSYLGQRGSYAALCGKTLTALSLASPLKKDVLVYDVASSETDYERGGARPNTIQTFSASLEAALRVAAVEEGLFYPDLKVYRVRSAALSSLYEDPNRVFDMALIELANADLPFLSREVNAKTRAAEPELESPVHDFNVAHGYYAPDTKVEVVDQADVAAALAKAGGYDQLLTDLRDHADRLRDWYKHHAPVARVNP